MILRLNRYWFAKAIHQELMALTTKKKQFSKCSLSSIQEMINYDTAHHHPKYQYHFLILKHLEHCLRSMNQFNKQTFKQLIPILSSLSKYPMATLSPDIVLLLYQKVCRNLQLRSEEEMNELLLFVLKIDPRAEESFVFLQFLRFYLNYGIETFKAQYRISIKQQTIGSFLKKISASLIQKSFLPRSPPYHRTLSVINRPQILKLLIQNPSTSKSLLIRKIYYQHFMKIKQLFERQMKKNLYHDKNKELWDMLNEVVECTFLSQCESIELESSFLAELHIKMFLVLKQKEQYPTILFSFEKTILLYQYCCHQISKESQLRSTFMKEYEYFIYDVANKQSQVGQGNLIHDLSLNRQLFLLWQKFPVLTHYCFAKLKEELSPLSFKVYLQQIVFFINSNAIDVQWLCQTVTINHVQQLTFSQYSLLITSLSESSNPKISRIIFQNILECIINKQAHSISGEAIIDLLQIYQKRLYFYDEKVQIGNLISLRTFLFRYIADHCIEFQKSVLGKIVNSVIAIDDGDSFDDEQGNYPNNIFEQLYTQLQNRIIRDQIVEKLSQKVKKQPQQHPT